MPFSKYNILHSNQVEKDVLEVTKLIDALIKEVALYISVRSINAKVFKFSLYSSLQKKVDNLLSKYADKIQASIEKNMATHWDLSIEKNELFEKNILKKYKGVPIPTRNAEGLKAFRERRNKEISSRVWKQNKQLKQELEMAIDNAIKNGTPANKLATELKQYLKEPERLFRRYRDNNGQLQLSKNALAYSPGQGVYRSSYKNAQRLARTEINMAYRLADISRWEQMDFIIGYEIKRSNNPYPCDICDMMKGKYPKTFVWSGNHSNCRCYLVPILQDVDDFLAGKDYKEQSINPKFITWVKKNKTKLKKAKSVPYFVKDNASVLGV